MMILNHSCFQSPTIEFKGIMENNSIMPFIVPVKDVNGRLREELMGMLVQYKMNESEPLYMLTEAEKIIDYNSSKERQKQKAKRTYFIKQKISGFVMFTIGIITPLLLDGDATFSLVAVPIGIGLIITKKKVMMFRR